MWNHRSDADLAAGVPAYRRIMPFLMRGRNESAVYFEQQLDIERAEAFIAEFNRRHAETPITLFHLVLYAAVETLASRPRLNRFVSGGQLWQRRGIWVSFSAKKRIDDDAPIVVIKRRFDPGQPFADFVAALSDSIGEGRSDKRSRVDKELSLLLALPTAVLGKAVGAAQRLDRWGLLPRSFIDGDPMFASLFIANLGSLKMDAAYHHLYEYGNIPIFCVIGRTDAVPAIRDGKLHEQRRAVLRYTYDERIEDGLYAQRSLRELQRIVEDPGAHGLTV